MNWEAYNYSFAVMVYCIIIGTVFALLPVTKVLYWACKILTISLLGPWMKLVDIFYVMPFYPPPNKADELECKVSFKCLSTYRLFVFNCSKYCFILKEPSFDEFFESPAFKLMTKKGRLAEEKALKVCNMRFCCLCFNRAV